LVVDELNDTGSTLVYCVKELQKACPAAVVVAVIHDKDKKKDAVLDKSIEYFVGKVVPDRWIVYPWEQ
jgi:hypoxanthine phosphoribosyltransferase